MICEPEHRRRDYRDVMPIETTVYKPIHPMGRERGVLHRISGLLAQEWERRSVFIRCFHGQRLTARAGSKKAREKLEERWLLTKGVRTSQGSRSCGRPQDRPHETGPLFSGRHTTIVKCGLLSGLGASASRHLADQKPYAAIKLAQIADEGAWRSFHPKAMHPTQSSTKAGLYRQRNIVRNDFFCKTG